MIFFTSDIHFYSPKILDREMRPFDSVLGMNHSIICTLNSQMTKKDTLYVLGDYGTSGEDFTRAYKTVRMLNAEVILICGNAEERIIKDNFANNFSDFRNWCKLCGFKDVLHHSYKSSYAGVEYTCRHIPVWDTSDNLQLYGHFHKSPGMLLIPGINVSMDANNFRALSEKDIIKLIDYQKVCIESFYEHFPNVAITIKDNGGNT